MAKAKTATKKTTKKSTKKPTTTNVRVTKPKAGKTATTRKTTKTAATRKTTRTTVSTTPKKRRTTTVKVGTKALTKTQLCTTLSDLTGLTKKEINTVLFEALPTVIKASLKSGASQFVLPGLLKAILKIKPATKARKGINPFTGEMTTFKAKPKSKTVKIQPLKGLKDMVATNKK